MRPRRACRVGVLVAGLSVVAVVGCSDRDSGKAGDGHANGGGQGQTGEPVDDGRQPPDAPDDGAWETYTTEDGLGADEVAAVAVAGDWLLSVTVDADEGVWVGTHDAGVSRFDGQRWSTYTADDGLGHRRVWSLAVGPDGAVWAGTDGGLSRFDGEEWRTYTREDGLAHDKVLSVAVDDQGVVWAGTADGLSRLRR